VIAKKSCFCSYGERQEESEDEEKEDDGDEFWKEYWAFRNHENLRGE
jgi:hypothetical protein